MATAYFISDVHLGELESPRSKAFLEFLRSLGPQHSVTHLFLLGDIFDLWIGNHQYFKNKFQPVIAEIQRLKEQGVEIHYFEGNHDLYLKSFWQDQLGLQVHSGPAVFKLDGQKIRVEHGDQMDPEDLGYIFLRWFLRTPLMKLVAKVLPGALVAAIGERASQASRNYTTHKKSIDAERAQKVIRSHAEKVYPQESFNLIVTGHVHLTDDHSFKVGDKSFRSINLGTWLGNPWVLKLDGGKSTTIEPEL